MSQEQHEGPVIMIICKELIVEITDVHALSDRVVRHLKKPAIGVLEQGRS